MHFIDLIDGLIGNLTTALEMSSVEAVHSEGILIVHYRQGEGGARSYP